MEFFLIAVIIVILILMFYLSSAPNAVTVDLNIMKSRVKSGDLVLFHAVDNMNSLFMFSYFTHVGIVYRPTTSDPMIFEVFETKKKYLSPHEHIPANPEVILSDFTERVRRYKGYVYIKHLESPLTQLQTYLFSDFVEKSKKNLHYEYQVIGNSIKKLLGYMYDSGTNCAEAVIRLLIRLDLLPTMILFDPPIHPMRFIAGCELTGNKYGRLHQVMSCDILFKD